MIRNIVFDLGRVLVEFDPKAYLDTLGFSAETAARLYDVIFGDDWRLHDRGDHKTVDDLCKALTAKHPELEREILTVLHGDWIAIHRVKPDTEAYLRELKKRGYHIYILSNLAAESHAYVSRFSFFRLVDGGVFSYQERACKPEEAIYRTLIDRYALVPAQTVFLDDNADNVRGAEVCGIHGVLFTDIQTARGQVEALIRENA